LLNVTVYSLSSSVCVGCRFTKRRLREAGIPFEKVRLEEDEGAREKIKEMGYTSAPVVEVDCGDGATWTWAGFQPTQIERLAALCSSSHS
jgi:glutaredoxin-like protein NrdH